MASATSKAVGYVVPVILIIAVLFFFLETRLGRQLLNDLKNALLVGSTDHGASDTNTNTISNLSSKSSGGTDTTPPTIPPPDVTQTLNNKAVPESGGAGGGNDKSKSSGGASTSGFGGGTPIPGIDLTGGVGVQPLFIPGVPDNKNPSVTPMIASVFDENANFVKTVPTNQELLASLEVGVTPKKTVNPTPNTSEPIAVSTPPAVAQTNIGAPSQAELDSITKIPNPISKSPDVLTQIEGIPQTLFNFFSNNPVFRLQPAPQDFFSTAPKVEVPIEGIPVV